MLGKAPSRPDHTLLAALAIVLMTVSAAIGSGLPHADNPLPRPAPVAKKAVWKPAPPNHALDELLAEHRCLAEVLYYEARGEGRQGQQAVAEVVFHRMNKGRYGHSICAVVYEGAGAPGCQFSFACDGSIMRPRDEEAWKQAERVAEEILTHQMPLGNATAGATNYHAVSANPFWAPTLQVTAQIGNHIFYRDRPHSRGV
ncbi:MAG TPA: cell wall hydrolase [Rhizomicrobium sp.]|nr:cell wall hydrolase [Rhizomicrobium sp.]